MENQARSMDIMKYVNNKWHRNAVLISAVLAVLEECKYMDGKGTSKSYLHKKQYYEHIVLQNLPSCIPASNALCNNSFPIKQFSFILKIRSRSGSLFS